MIYLSKICIVTDSTADIPDELVGAHGIKVIPLTVYLDGKSYLDRVNISNQEIYSYLSQCEQLPTTSQISPGEFVKTYTELAEAGYDGIVSVHLSKQLSGTVESARIASKMVEDKIKVAVVDSLSATIGLGSEVLFLAKMAEKGASLEEVSKTAEELAQKMDIIFLLDSLNNLEKGGRIGKASFLIGSILNIKPILRLKDGVIDCYEKVRGNKANKALLRLVDIVESQIDKTRPVHMVFGYNDKKESADLLRQEMSTRDLDIIDDGYFELGSVVSTHIGLGAFGVAFFQEQ